MQGRTLIFFAKIKLYILALGYKANTVVFNKNLSHNEPFHLRNIAVSMDFVGYGTRTDKWPKLDSYLQLRWSSTCFSILIWLRINHTTYQWPYISVSPTNQENLILISAMVGHQIVKNDNFFLCLYKLSWFWLSNITNYPFTTIKRDKAHEKGEF